MKEIHDLNVRVHHWPRLHQRLVGPDLCPLRLVLLEWQHSDRFFKTLDVWIVSQQLTLKEIDDMYVCVHLHQRMIRTVLEFVLPRWQHSNNNFVISDLFRNNQMKQIGVNWTIIRQKLHYANPHGAPPFVEPAPMNLSPGAVSAFNGRVTIKITKSHRLSYWNWATHSFKASRI